MAQPDASVEARPRHRDGEQNIHVLGTAAGQVRTYHGRRAGARFLLGTRRVLLAPSHRKAIVANHVLSLMTGKLDWPRRKLVVLGVIGWTRPVWPRRDGKAANNRPPSTQQLELPPVVADGQAHRQAVRSRHSGFDTNQPVSRRPRPSYARWSWERRGTRRPKSIQVRVPSRPARSG